LLFGVKYDKICLTRNFKLLEIEYVSSKNFPVRPNKRGQKLEGSLREGKFLPAYCPAKRDWARNPRSRFFARGVGIFLKIGSDFV